MIIISLMSLNKRKVLIIVFVITISLTLIVNKIILSFMPQEYIAKDGTYTSDSFIWLASWSAPLSFVVAILVYGLTIRYMSYKNKKDK
jgi:archaellum biogenesis protein FlaJ (TadC family)